MRISEPHGFNQADKLEITTFGPAPAMMPKSG
jgi:hypothetical protein